MKWSNQPDRFCIRYCTAAVDKRVRDMSLYHCRQCSIVVKPRSDCIDYSVVCFVTHDCSRELWKHSTTSASWVWFKLQGIAPTLIIQTWTLKTRYPESGIRRQWRSVVQRHASWNQSRWEKVRRTVENMFHGDGQFNRRGASEVLPTRHITAPSSHLLQHTKANQSRVRLYYSALVLRLKLSLI